MPDPSKPQTTWWSNGLFIVPAIILFVVFGGLALLFLPRMLLTEWLPADATSEDRNRALGQAAQIVLFSLGGVIALVGVGVSLSRHGEELRAAERDRERATLQREAHELDEKKEVQRRAEHDHERDADAERTLRSRFVAAVDLLGQPDSAIKRTAGLYAIAALADDWQKFGRLDERQTCIDVLCGYLRSPLPPEIEHTPKDEKEVRRTGYTLIRDHLREPSSHDPAWAGATIPLTGAFIDFNVDLSGMVVPANTVVQLDRVRLVNRTLNLSELRIRDRGQLHLVGAYLNGSKILLDRSSVSGSSQINLARAVVDGGTLSLQFMSVVAKSRLDLDGIAVGNRGRVQLDATDVQAESAISMDEGRFDDAVLSIEHLTVWQRSEAFFNIRTRPDTVLLDARAQVAEDSTLIGPFEMRDAPR